MARHDQKDTGNSRETGKETSMGREILGTVLYIAFICLAVFFILHYVGQRTVVDGDSMYPTLEDQENLIMDKLSYHFSDPERYDIVIFPGTEPDDPDSHPYFIKRVIGLPGETVQIKDGKIYIDGELLDTDIYAYGGYTEDTELNYEEPYELKSDEYFCMGDNRSVSFDSRYSEVGPVKREEIIGKVWIRIWPFSKFGDVEYPTADIAD